MPFKGFEKAPVLRYPEQATFHPLKYLKGLAAAIRDKGGHIYADTPVTGVEELEDSVRLATEAGHSVEASQAVFATNSPINNRVALHSKMAPYRTYAMAFTLPKGTLPDALYWDMADPYHYVRLNPVPALWTTSSPAALITSRERLTTGASASRQSRHGCARWFPIWARK